MILNFENIDNNIELCREHISVIEIENKALFLSLFTALYDGDGNNEKQPFTIYEKNDERLIKSSNSFCFITDIMNIELNSKKVIAAATERVSERCFNDESIYRKINDANLIINTSISELLNEYCVDFSISSEWNTAQYLKAFRFGIYEYETGDILNKLFQYISICSEFIKKSIVCIINLKSYLNETEINEFYKFVLYNKVPMLLFESNIDNRVFQSEHKLIIDKEFDEFVSIC